LVRIQDLQQFDKVNHNPAEALAALEKQVKSSFNNPTKFQTEISLQTHSITIVFLSGKEEKFSVDIVPAYSSDTNEFGDDMYMVPELVRKKHKDRKSLYENLSTEQKQMEWIKSDPRGHITLATRVNGVNDDFRKAVKFVKAWKNACKDYDENFKLKSFHLEQVMTGYFREGDDLEIYDAIFRFFCSLPEIISGSAVPDRADPSKNIDNYIDELTSVEKSLIMELRDGFLVALESFDGGDVSTLLSANQFERIKSEEYLFDSGIPTLVDPDLSINIQGKVLERNGSFSAYILDKVGLIVVDREIEFTSNGMTADLIKWKVRNDADSAQPRGEITNHRTKNHPEHTKYRGSHFVECYAICDGVCVAKAKQNVVLKSIFNGSS
jgi:hypothetical protein